MTEPCKITPAAPVPPAALLAIQPHPDAPEPCPLDHSCEEGEQCGCWCDLHDCPIANCPSYKLVTAWLDDARREGVAAGRTAAAAAIRAAPYPDPSPCIPAWHAGYVEAWFRAARIAENGADQ